MQEEEDREDGVEAQHGLLHGLLASSYYYTLLRY